MPESPVVNVRLRPDELEMLDYLVEWYRSRREGAIISRSDILRMVIREEHKRLQRLKADKERQR